jgi:hypothetical protein
MQTTEYLTHCAELNEVNDCLGTLEKLRVIDAELRVQMTRKYMEDRPAFKEAVTKAMSAN